MAFTAPPSSDPSKSPTTDYPQKHKLRHRDAQSRTAAASLIRTLSSLNPLPSLRLSLSHPLWHAIERLYALPAPPPPRRRAPDNPMQVICVGLPRTGTESLQQALLTLGYKHTYHGWDIVYDDECHSPGWVRLARKKWYGPLGSNKGGGSGGDGTRKISAAEFDALIGHCAAVTDAAASCFAADMIAAYPNAKVVLNMRRDVDAWQRSLVKTLVHANESWGFWIASWLDRECFWAWHVYERFLWPLLFRAPDGDMGAAIRNNARWVAEEHCNMIRGLVPKERLLEWYIEDGWEPLCKFLGKPVPEVEFPHANAAAGGWKDREALCNKRWVDRAFANLILGVVGMVVSVVLARIYVLFCCCWLLRLTLVGSKLYKPAFPGEQLIRLIPSQTVRESRDEVFSVYRRMSHEYAERQSTG